jgi:hypothetical protein
MDSDEIFAPQIECVPINVLDAFTNSTIQQEASHVAFLVVFGSLAHNVVFVTSLPVGAYAKRQKQFKIIFPKARRNIAFAKLDIDKRSSLFQNLHNTLRVFHCLSISFSSYFESEPSSCEQMTK